VKLDDTLLSLCFRRTTSKHTINVRRNDDSQLVVGVYVDDLIITSLDHDDIKLFKEEMTDTFEMSDLDIEVK
jgi:hypothetical protein